MEWRDETSLNILKKRNKNSSKTPSNISAENRKINIIHVNLRHNCILIVNNDLLVFRKNFTDSPLCSCGQVEDSCHFFFLCTLYNQARNRLCTCNELLKIDQIKIIDKHCLLLGNEILTINVLVHNYIRDSSRFD